MASQSSASVTETLVPLMERLMQSNPRAYRKLTAKLSRKLDKAEGGRRSGCPVMRSGSGGCPVGAGSGHVTKKGHDGKHGHHGGHGHGHGKHSGGHHGGRHGAGGWKGGKRLHKMGGRCLQACAAKSEFKVFAVVHGYKKEEISVKLSADGKQITVHGKHEERDDCMGWGKISREFTRRYDVPDDVLTQYLQAVIGPRGMLVVWAPRKPANPVTLVKGQETNIPINVLGAEDATPTEDSSSSESEDEDEEGFEEVVAGEEVSAMDTAQPGSAVGQEKSA